MVHNEEYLIGIGNKDFTEDDYPFVVRNIIEYIDDIKKEEKHMSLLDIIIDYSFKTGIDLQVIGDAIASDVYFKSFIEKDCESKKILKSKCSQIDSPEW